MEPGVEPDDGVYSMPLAPQLPDRFAIVRTPDVLRLLDHSVKCVAADTTARPIEKGRAFAYIAATAARVTGITELEERVARIEALGQQQLQRIL